MPRISQLTELTVAEPTDMVPIYEASTGIAKKISVQALTGLPDFGWTATGESWSYASWSATTRIGTITVPTDATTKYSAGMRIRISQSTGGTKYGIITKVEATTLTVFFPSGTTLNNEAISTPVYSSLKSPFGFPASPTVWSLSLESSNDRTISSASLASLTDALVVGIGAWRMVLKGTIARPYAASTSNDFYKVTLSSTTNSETHPNLSFVFNLRFGSASASSGGNGTTQTTDDVLLTVQTTFTVLGQRVAGANGTLQGSGGQATVVRAICGYL